MSSLLSFQAHLEKYRQKKYYSLSISVLGGILMALGWYFPFSPLLFVGLIPLLELIEFYFTKYEIQKNELENTTKKKNYFTRLCFFTWIYFVIWNIGTYWWLWNAVGVGVIGIFLLNAFLQLLPIIVYIFTRRFSVGFIDYLSLVSCWVFFEYIHLNWLLSYPWMNIGNAFGQVPIWVQWYEYTGALGGTIWVLLANILAYHVFIKSEVKVGAFAVLVLVPIAFSYGLYSFYDESETSINQESVEMVVVQPNLDCYSEKFARNPKTGEPSTNHIPFEVQIQRYINLAKSVITDSTKYIIFPETAFHQNATEYDYTSQEALKPVFDFCRENNLILISGADTYKFYTGNDTVPKTARKTSEGDAYYDSYNSAVQFVSFVEDSVSFYHKSKLVIGAETNPIKMVLPNQSASLLFVDIMGTMGTQSYRSVFVSPNSKAKVAPVICWEAVYGEFCTEYAQNGANVIVIPTNEGWWGNTPAPRQLWALSALRAIETRRSVARAANTGISGFIDQRGKDISRSNYGEQTALKHTIKLNNQLTFYALHGDYLGRIAGFLAVVFFISAFVRKLRNK